MRRYAYVHVDVFTSARFGGNQLAVFTDARGLSGEEMQSIAGEMNFAESTFVLPPEDPANTARVRIFTTVVELPFAGHPMVGTAWVLARRSGAAEVRLELGVGLIDVVVDAADGVTGGATMRQPLPDFQPATLDEAGVAALVGLDRADLADFAPIEVGSAGTPFLLVPVRSREAVDAARGTVELGKAFADAPFHGVYLFALGGDGASAVAYARMFHPAPGGVPQEDPATGSAAGPLGAYLVRHRIAPAGALLFEQGYALGRPSQLYVTVETAGERIARVDVGGGVVLVAEGEMVV